MNIQRLSRRLGLVGLAAVASAVTLAPVLAPVRPAVASVQLVRFGGGHFGGSSRGLGFGSRPSLGRGVSRLRRPSNSRGFLRRIGHALAFAAVLHFLFAGSHGLGFVFFLILIAGVVVLLMRRRRRVYRRY